MVGITGQGNSFNLPNYVGELFNASPEDTPLLSAIGGLTGGRAASGKLFEWQGYDLRDAADDRQRLEGADAGAGEQRVRYSESNVLEIHQESVEITYTKQASNLRATDGEPFVTVGGTSLPASELAWQLEQQFKQVSRDIEKTFITGTYANPSDNTAPRKTRGLLEAITTNAVAAEYPLGGDPREGLTEDLVLDLMQSVWTNGGIQESETRTLLVNAGLKRALSNIFVRDNGFQETTRNVGGVNVQTIETDFGRVNIMLDRYVPAGELIVASLEELAPRFLEIPGKGHFFAEPLAKTGSADKVQIYGEIGLEYGQESKHGKISLTEAAA